jgi:hypothetical protein
MRKVTKSEFFDVMQQQMNTISVPVQRKKSYPFRTV